ncbi:glycosyl hydrolase family 18 protein [Demequina aurantiaca]|uniref:glycosyl hydrolase family 18 protein n=1 Tax=Demequina aurantiaca TaxID=676200 RepID=UPI0009FBE4C0|nr:glycosyl hydrolase family 18 protein [Demequina aurantiaca]
MSKSKKAKAPRSRVSIVRVGLVLACTGLLGWAGYAAVASVVSQTEKTGPSTFAGYVDATLTPTYSYGTPAGPAQSNVILSFVVADPTSGCTPLWGGAYTLDAAADELEMDRRITQLRSTGGDVRVSFGGQAGTELAAACTDVSALEDAYQSVVDRYQVASIDLDIEGASLADSEGGARRATAIKAVQDNAIADGQQLAVWLTLPVATSGLTADGIAVVDQMLDQGVDLAGVNGMTMDFNSGVSPTAPYSDAVLEAANSLHVQVSDAYRRIGTKLDSPRAWEKVGITPMIGQNDVAGEVFTIEDAQVVNEFAREHGVGQLSMWSLNRDAECQSPLPKIITVVQNTCSGVDQGSQSFAEVLAADLPNVLPTKDEDSSPSAAPTSSAAPSPTSASGDEVDDPAHSPFPIWDPLGDYPGGTKIVWHKNVYEARYWTSGMAPGTPVANPDDSPWTLVGPVLPGDTPAPLPTLAPGSYPQWNETEKYTTGTRVQLGNVPYEAKWWSQGQEPGVPAAGGSPWVLITPAEGE